MITEKKYHDAVSLAQTIFSYSFSFVQMKVYKTILEMDPENIDAMNSLTICIKNTTGPDQDCFNDCHDLYLKALEVSERYLIFHR